jgi:hypothetical protein
VDAARMAKAHRPAQDRRPRQAHLPRLEHDGLIKRKVAGLLVFAEKDTQENGILVELA